MINAAMLLGIFLLLAGVLVFLLPAKRWGGLTAQGSRWRKQASSAGLLAFARLGWVELILLIAYSAMVMEARLTQYALGVSLPVFIDPSDGVESALMPNIATEAGIYGALSLVVVLIATGQLTKLVQDWSCDQVAGDMSVPNDARHARRILK